MLISLFSNVYRRRAILLSGVYKAITAVCHFKNCFKYGSSYGTHVNPFLPKSLALIFLANSIPLVFANINELFGDRCSSQFFFDKCKSYEYTSKKKKKQRKINKRYRAKEKKVIIALYLSIDPETKHRYRRSVTTHSTADLIN